LVVLSKVKALCVATRCTSADQFVSMFHRFSDETSFFVATMNQRAVGLETPFSIQLADRSPVLRGTCVVLAAWPTSDNPFKRPGVRLGIRRLTPESEPVFARLREARLHAGEHTTETEMDMPSETPVAIPLTQTGSFPRPHTQSRTATGQPQRRLGSVMTPALIPPKTPPEANVLEIILPIVADSPSEAMALPVEIEPPIEHRTPGSDFILPANPLMNLTDESLQGFVDCTLYEDTANFPNDPEMAQIMPAIPLLAGDEQVLVSRAGDQVVVTAPAAQSHRRCAAPAARPPVSARQNVLRRPSVGTAADPHAHSGSGAPAIRLEASGLFRVDTPTGQSEPLRIETQSGHSGQLRLESSGLLRVEHDSGQSGLLRIDGHSGMFRIDAAPPPMPPQFPMHSQAIQPVAPQQKFFHDVHTPVPPAYIRARSHELGSRASRPG
jgi:hypothetical protein